MESRREDDPWRAKGRIEFVACADIVVAILGLAWCTYRMFTFYWNAEDQMASDLVKDADHIKFYVFVWVVIMLLYAFQIGTSCVLYSAINLEATESDPYISCQKCNFWLRCSRVILLAVVTKLCLQPVIILIGEFTNVYTIVFGLAELLFRSFAMIAVRQFVQDLQQ